MENSAIFEELVLLVEDAIDTEIGEKREYKPQTELSLQLFQERLAKLLGLPADYSI